MIIFDLLDIDLVHGWLPDPQEKDTFDLLSSLSYNQVQEKLIEFVVITSESGPTSAQSEPTPVKSEQVESTLSNEPTGTKSGTVSEIVLPSPPPKAGTNVSPASKRFTNSPLRSSPIVPSKSAIEEKKNSIKPEDHEMILLQGIPLFF